QPLEVVLKYLAHYARWALSNNLTRPPSVAIAYAKADEYGVTPDVPARMLGTRKSRLLLAQWREALRDRRRAELEAPKLWGELIDEIVSQDVRPFPARRIILESTEKLWRELVTSELNLDQFNAYLVAAEPVKPTATASPRDGVHYMFSDFFAH